MKSWFASLLGIMIVGVSGHLLAHDQAVTSGEAFETVATSPAIMELASKPLASISVLDMDEGGRGAMEMTPSPRLDAARAVVAKWPSLTIRSDFVREGKVAVSTDGRVLLSKGDRVSFRFNRAAEPEPQRVMAVVRPVQDVIHPASRRRLGDLVQFVGLVQLNEPIKGTWTGWIVDSPSYVSPGDFLVSVDAYDAGGTEGVNIGRQPASKDGSGYIVAVQDDVVLMGTHQIVFSDWGQDRGVKVGDRFAVIREERFRAPSRTIGEVEVISSQPTSSSVLVTRSEEAIRIGDRLEPLAIH